MEKIKDVLKTKSYQGNVNNDNKYINNNGINVNGNNEKYFLDKNKFVPNTEKTQLAEEISNKLGDKNFAGFLDVVNKIGCVSARALLAGVLQDIQEKKETQTPVRNAGAYFIWKFTKGMY